MRKRKSDWTRQENALKNRPVSFRLLEMAV